VEDRLQHLKRYLIFYENFERETFLYLPLNVLLLCPRAGKKGYSWTFLTPEQDWYSGDVIRALELSESLVPQVGFTPYPKKKEA
jgi:hypothetical protein